MSIFFLNPFWVTHRGPRPCTVYCVPKQEGSGVEEKKTPYLFDNCFLPGSQRMGGSQGRIIFQGLFESFAQWLRQPSCPNDVRIYCKPPAIIHFCFYCDDSHSGDSLSQETIWDPVDYLLLYCLIVYLFDPGGRKKYQAHIEPIGNEQYILFIQKFKAPWGSQFLLP